MVDVARTVAASLVELLENDTALARTVLLQILSAPHGYVGTSTLIKQAARGVPLEQMVVSDVNGIVNYGAGKVNELLTIKSGELVKELFSEANKRFATANAGEWAARYCPLRWRSTPARGSVSPRTWLLCQSAQAAT